MSSSVCSVLLVCPSNNSAICSSHPHLPARQSCIPHRSFQVLYIHRPAAWTCLPINQLDSNQSYQNIPKHLRKPQPNEPFPPGSCNFQTENREEGKKGAFKGTLSPSGWARFLSTSHFQPEKEVQCHMLLENQLSTGLSLKPTQSWSLSLYPVKSVRAPFC